MKEYLGAWWNGLTQAGRTVVSVAAIIVALVAFGLALLYDAAFEHVIDALDKLLP